jgi:hypothetical protein
MRAYGARKQRIRAQQLEIAMRALVGRYDLARHEGSEVEAASRQ